MENRKKQLKTMMSLGAPNEVEKIDGLYFASTKSGCGGFSCDKDLAIIQAIGEDIERHALRKYILKQLPFGSYQQLCGKLRLLNPSELLLFSEAQYKLPDFAFVPFSSKSETHWVETREILSGQKIYIPAPFIFLSYQKKECRKPFIIPTSSGTACHQSFEQAALSAIYELVERDAILGMWYKKYSPPKIGQSLSMKKTIKKIFPDKDEVISFYDLKSDLGIPVVLAKCQGRGFSSFGSSCNFDYQRAMEKALLECFQTSYAIKNLREDNHIEQKAENEINDFIDHLLYYAREENQKYLNFLDEGKAIISERRKKMPLPLEKITKKFLHNGLGPLYLADITPLKIKASGLSVVRAFCPALLQLNVGPANRYLANPRAFAWKQFCREGKMKNLNPKPHPFA
ncbi:MAG: YcaO-like family protein [Bdellovibrio sp.]|nr:YcaO-like family protein [Bdellovibrio sp.]